jgi:hypothetical protein
LARPIALDLIWQHTSSHRYIAPAGSATMSVMTKTPGAAAILVLVCFSLLGRGAEAQTASSNGTLELTVRITPTSARPEPVRQFTFYLLTKSYEEIAKEIDAGDKLPTREKFINDLKVSKELKDWLKAHDVLDLAAPGLDKEVTADEIVRTPEFLLAYQRSNSGGVTNGLPTPKYTEAEKTEKPERYEKQKQEYLAALKKFIAAHPETLNGIELELDSVNPQNKWVKLQSDHTRRVLRLAPEVAQTKYLAAKADTDLDGRAILSGLAAGNYWISTLNLDAAAGDTRLRWDVEIAIKPGQAARIELTNLNATDAHASTP